VLLEEKRARIAYLEEQFRVAQHKQFGKSTEGHPGQGELFNEAEELVVEAETAEETISYTRKKPTRKPLPYQTRKEPAVAQPVSHMAREISTPSATENQIR
jgi:hypothetical protein|tara:strand:- start:235 stop:537 length:303 start_codon:yes stop_codon:yes gene_type:complete